MAPGLKPSLRFHSVGSIATPDEFDGHRLPVEVHAPAGAAGGVGAR